jgi:hypothetical protein
VNLKDCSKDINEITHKDVDNILHIYSGEEYIGRAWWDVRGEELFFILKENCGLNTEALKQIAKYLEDLENVS